MKINQKEKIDMFIKELNELTNKYDLGITAEGKTLLLRDRQDYMCLAEFGFDFFRQKYVINID